MLRLSDSELIGLAADCGIFEKDPSNKIECGLDGCSYVSYPSNIENPKITKYGEGVHGLLKLSQAIYVRGSLAQIKKVKRMKKKVREVINRKAMWSDD